MKRRIIISVCAIVFAVVLIVGYELLISVPRTIYEGQRLSLCMTLLDRASDYAFKPKILHKKSLDNEYAFLSSALIAYESEHRKTLYATVVCLHPKKEQTEDTATAALRYLRISDKASNQIELHRIAVHQLPISADDVTFRLLRGDWRRVFARDPTRQRISSPRRID
jgi:hypothetical protein